MAFGLTFEKLYFRHSHQRVTFLKSQLATESTVYNDFRADF